ncbi:MAG TPA: hypothetical protein VFA70_05915 [Dehalococcoidia bacterium]|nr:hypothetical protein [Dehalococcoidia bacterium]
MNLKELSAFARDFGAQVEDGLKAERVDDELSYALVLLHENGRVAYHSNAEGEQVIEALLDLVEKLRGQR